MDRNIDIQEKKDLLQVMPELKKMPFSVPEGYFESAIEQARSHSVRNEKRLWSKIYPIASMAAMFAVIAVSGTLILRHGFPGENESQQMQMEDYLIYSGYDFTSLDYQAENNQLAEAEIDSEDRVQYLIYTGISVEDLEE